MRTRTALWLLLWGLSAAAGAQDWPSFRGPFATGVADGQGLPVRFDVDSGDGVLWRVPVEGLAHSSPIVWSDTIFLATAVSSRADADFKEGLYGEGTASDDRSEQQWVVLALDLANGAVRWRSAVHRGAPREKRHVKATYANQTPATDGKVVVAFFGSEGIYALDAADGRVLWTRDVGRLDVGAYDAPTYEWGSASSPILWDGKVFVQCDTQGADFVLALDAATGETVWRAERDELPSWGTPTVAMAPSGPELVTNASNFIRGYDPQTGRELWRLGGSSQITAPTPLFDRDSDLIVVASGRRPVKPLFVVRAGARGDLTLPEGESSSPAVVWSRRGRGPYMPTPLVYRGVLYVLNNDGIFDAYDLRSGEELFRERIQHHGAGFSGSPVAADGVLYLPSEDGDLYAVRAARAFELIATSSLGERVMTTPAISQGRMVVRTRGSLFALGAPRRDAASGR